MPLKRLPQAENAKNGFEAVQMFGDFPNGYYDMIVMDIQMPVMGGIEGACRIHGLKKADARPLEIDKIDRVMEHYIHHDGECGRKSEYMRY